MQKDIINLASLACIQFSNAFLPIFIFPYVFKVIGADMFSKVMVSESVALICLALVIYSFDINGVSKVIGLDLKRDIHEVSVVFSGVFCVRLIIYASCIILIILLSPLLGKDYFSLLICWMLIPLSYIIQSFWFFQGLEKNTSPAIFTLISRLLCIVLIIKVINEPSDYYLVPVIIGLCYFLGGLLSLAYAIVKFRIKIYILPLSEIRKLLFDGKEIFFGNMSVMLFRDFNVLILKILTNNAVAISTYSMAEKLIKCLQATARPLNQLFYQKVISLIRQFSKPNEIVFKKIVKLVIPQLAALAIITVTIIIGYIFLGNSFIFLDKFPQKDRIAMLFIIMTIAVFFGSANFMLGSTGLNHLNEKIYYSKSIFAVGVFSIAICMFSVSLLGAFGASLAFVLSEILLFCLIVKKYFSNAKITSS